MMFAEIKGGGGWKGMFWRVLMFMANSWERWIKRLDKDKEKHWSAQISLREKALDLRFQHFTWFFSVMLNASPKSLFTQKFVLYFLFLREWETRCWMLDIEIVEISSGTEIILGHKE